MKRLLFSIVCLCVSALITTGCGDPTDSPEDCTVNEFFNEVDALCQTCAAIVVPTCREGCGFIVTQDENSCPIAECDSACQQCPENEQWSDDTLSCKPVDCGVNRFYDAAAGGCATCPEQENTCEFCTCSSVTQEPDARGCLQTVCSGCFESTDPGYTVQDGQCVQVNL